MHNDSSSESSYTVPPQAQWDLVNTVRPGVKWRLCARPLPRSMQTAPDVGLVLRLAHPALAQDDGSRPPYEAEVTKAPPLVGGAFITWLRMLDSNQRPAD